ncbi:MAG: hypothetical protein Q8R92_06235 [Deltaproteobacteria bacterium]|nr:hypothetical protein [Deltaproteobacteria bacterium]
MVERTRSRRGAGGRVDGGGNYFAAPKDDIDFVPTGCVLLDLALGGGWAERKVCNIIGDSSSGKTLLATEAMANFLQKYPKGKARFRDVEEAFIPSYARTLGVDVDKIDFGSGDAPILTVEDLYEDLEAVTAKARRPEFYVVDSLDSLSDRAELARKFDEPTFGGNKAKQMSQLFRRITSLVEKSNVTLMFISQVRADIGPFASARGTKQSGGWAVRFYRSQALYLSTKGKIYKTVRGLKKPLGINVRAYVDKNRVGLPYREAEFPILFGYGIDDVAASLDWLKSIKRLDELGISNTVEKGELLKIKRQYTLAEGGPEVPAEEITALVKKNWYEIEEQILPTRRKYGG